MLEFLRNLFTMQRNRNERGASAVEYGLLVGGIAAVVVVMVFALGGKVSGMFKDTCDKVSAGNAAVTTTNDCTP